jgi:LysM repeat protein
MPGRLARKSRLLRIIDCLLWNPEPGYVDAARDILARVHVPSCLSSIEGRLECIEALIARQSGAGFTRAEKKALKLLARELNGIPEDGGPFLGFAIRRLRLTLALALQPEPAGYKPPRVLAGCAVAVVSVSGLLAQACTPRQEFAESLAGLPPVMPAVQALPPPPVDEPAESAPAAPPRSARELQRSPAMYTVQKGDSVRAIADRFGISYRDIVACNTIAYDAARDWFVLYPGQQLMLPGEMPAAVSAGVRDSSPAAAQQDDYLALGRCVAGERGLYHLVQRGDSLWKLARHYGISIDRLARANAIDDPCRIRFGQMLKIPGAASAEQKPFHSLCREEKIEFLKHRTIKSGHPYLETLVDVAEEFKVDPRLYAALIWEESWFDPEARSKDNCLKLAQLDPRYHPVSDSVRENFAQSLRYLKHEFTYYRSKGFDSASATICALAAYNGGNSRIRRFIRNGVWDGRSIDTIPIAETRAHLRKILQRCESNYHALL